MNSLCKAMGVVALTVLCAAAQASPQTPAISATAKPAAVKPGGSGTLTVTVTVPAGFHINANKVSDPSLIPTAFRGSAPSGVKFGAPRYPAGHALKMAGYDKPVSVYTGKTIIVVPFKVAKTAKPGKLALAGSLGYQACNDQSCFPPASAPVTAAVTIK